MNSITFQPILIFISLSLILLTLFYSPDLDTNKSLGTSFGSAKTENTVIISVIWVLIVCFMFVSALRSL